MTFQGISKPQTNFKSQNKIIWVLRELLHAPVISVIWWMAIIKLNADCFMAVFFLSCRYDKIKRLILSQVFSFVLCKLCCWMMWTLSLDVFSPAPNRKLCVKPDLCFCIGSRQSSRCKLRMCPAPLRAFRPVSKCEAQPFVFLSVSEYHLLTCFSTESLRQRCVKDSPITRLLFIWCYLHRAEQCIFRRHQSVILHSEPGWQIQRRSHWCEVYQHQLPLLR